MLVLTRKPEQEIVIKTSAGEEIRIKICDIESRDRVKIGITAPRSVSVVRAELIKGDEERGAHYASPRTRQALVRRG
jgi:carbon storage regulator CsrA